MASIDLQLYKISILKYGEWYNNLTEIQREIVRHLYYEGYYLKY